VASVLWYAAVVGIHVGLISVFLHSLFAYFHTLYSLEWQLNYNL
jgi:hypothetical protein